MLLPYYLHSPKIFHLFAPLGTGLQKLEMEIVASVSFGAMLWLVLILHLVSLGADDKKLGMPAKKGYTCKPSNDFSASPSK